MKTIYIVVGSTGDYELHETWNVIAYLDKSAAQTHVDNANKRAKEIHVLRGDISKNEFDPEMCMDFGGTLYTLCEISLIA